MGPNHKVVVLALGNLVALAEEFGQLALHVSNRIGRLGLHEKGAELGVAREPFHHTGVRHQNHVVLILAETAGALCDQPAHDGERGVLDADDLADRIDVFTEDRLGRGAADQADLVGIADVRLGEVISAAQRPGAGRQVFRADAGHLHETVLVAGRDLDRGAGFRADRRDAEGFFADGLVVRRGQVGGHAETAAHSATGHVAGDHRQEVLAHAGNAFVHLRLRPGAHAHPHDHGGDADNDAEHGEERPENIPAQGTKGDFENG